MAENDKPTGYGANGGQAAPQSAQVRVLGQYIKDLSFENPNVAKLLAGAPENPSLKVEIDVSSSKFNTDVYESAIDFKASATTGSIGVIYDFELAYAGLFRIENVPPQALEPMLLVHCPMLLFPFMRRIVADLTREGGFPPLLLDPVDFGALFVRKQSQRMTASKPAP